MVRHGLRLEGRVLRLRARVLVKDVEGLKQMVEDTMEKVTGLRLEDKGEETETRVTKTGENQESEEAAGNVRTEEMITGVEDEGEIRTEERKEMYYGATLMATHAYTRNPESAIGKEMGQIVISGILPVFGNSIQGYRHSKRMAVNGMMKRLCKEEDVGYVDLWDSFVGKEDM